LSAYRIEANKLRTTKILTVRTESPTVKTFTFKDKECANAKPGQFLMLWVPRIDEIPLSILDVDEEGIVSVAVKNVGEATQALHKKRAGEIIGVRGAFGNGFTVREGRILMVGGGTGVAPLFFLARLLSRAKLVFVLGAKTRTTCCHDGGWQLRRCWSVYKTLGSALGKGEV
jgi:dihydroorotate dehydrogenase electron transfer subunit